MDTIIFKKIAGGYLFALENRPATSQRYFGYRKAEAYRLYKERMGILRAHLKSDTHSISYGYQGSFGAVAL